MKKHLAFHRTKKLTKQENNIAARFLFRMIFLLNLLLNSKKEMF